MHILGPWEETRDPGENPRRHRRCKLHIERFNYKVQLLLRHTDFTDVHGLCAAKKASYMCRAGGSTVLVVPQTPFKLHKLLGAVLSDLLDHRAMQTNTDVCLC